jgi:hypothetical protein
MALHGNGKIAYYCFIVALGLKSKNQEILEQMFKDK